MMRTITAAGLLLCLVLQAQPNKLKIYISVDMEGIAGVASGDQLIQGKFEYERFRNFMTLEALAAINAARGAGVTEMLVGDVHGNGQNLLIEQFPPEVRIVRSYPRRLGMMAGIDSSFDAVLLVGYHASTHNMRGVRAHTFSSSHLTRVSLNGKNVTEAAWAAATAGHFGVPAIFVSGDDAAIEEIQSEIGNIEAAETKKALGFHSASTLTPEASRRLIGQKVAAALSRVRDFKPYKIGNPVTVDVSFKNPTVVEALSYLRIFKRTDSHSIRFIAENMIEASDFMEFLTGYSPTLQP
jgi:D-amino peptidase